MIWLPFPSGHVIDSTIYIVLLAYREYHSGVVTAKREKQSQLKMEDYVSRTESSQGSSTADDLAGFQTEHSAKSTGASGKGNFINPNI